MSITKNDLKQGTKLKIKDAHKLTGAEVEIEVCYAGDVNVVVRSSAGQEITTDYNTLGLMYEVVPLVVPTKENLLPRLKDELEKMIMHLAAFNSYQAAGKVDHNILVIGSTLHALKDEVTSYVAPESVIPEGLRGLMVHKAA
jgi:hypothetical protein